MTDDADFPEYLDVDYTAGDGEGPEDYPALVEKFERATAVTERALDTYRNPVVLWTGGKDSTLVLYVVREVAAERGFDVPPVLFIDHYQHFDAVHEFVAEWADRWELDLAVARNEDFSGLDADPGDGISVSDLPERTRHELDRLDFDGDTLAFSPDTLEGNHLLKTVALNDAIEDGGYDGVFSGVRWDEQAARADETFFSPRHDDAKYPPHDRIHPILPFDERAVWDATWGFVVPDTVERFPAGYVPQDRSDLPNDLSVADLPVNPKYFDGFRSLGTADGSGTGTDRPAWLQDLDATTEREGRAQDKEGLMERLRDLGYM
jgi:phosphoadenosine phosphosulfate reductase